MSISSVPIGIIGCGVISGAYLAAIRDFPILAPRLVADLDMAAAKKCAEEFDLKAVSVAELLDDRDIEIVLNLTIPAAHIDVGLKVLAAGKHVYCEKPLGIAVEEARTLLDAARKANLRVGSAPDTFLGSGHQKARQLIDEGAIGKPIAGAAYMMVPGHERWHPNPSFYYDINGGGPLLDMGPYYLTNLVQMLGPVRQVTAFGGIFRDQREIATGPKAGQSIAVGSLTHIAGTLEFDNRAIVQIATSFEVFAHRHQPIEIYGDAGSILIPDPNHFGGEVEVAGADCQWRKVETNRNYSDGNFRGIGLADMASAIRQERPHRANGALAFHVLEVMEGLITSANEPAIVKIESTVDRTHPLAPDEIIGQLGVPYV